MYTPISIEIIFELQINLHKLYKFMQIELNKYFITSAAKRERERNTLTTSRELPARKHAGRTHHLCPKESEHTVLLSVPHKEAHLFLAAYCRRLSVMLDQFCTFLENLTIHNEERARRRVIFCGNRQ